MGVIVTKKYMQSVADFLSAGRSAGRYLVSMAEGIAMLGAITVIANFEMNYKAGFIMYWWQLTMSVFLLIITVSGWVIYRFRETRALTMAQFFEMRYSRKFRVFAGMLAFVAGILNFGIFPSVGARFFIYFAGLPKTFDFLGIELSTYAVTMFLLLAIAIFFVFTGGQIAVIVTDFLQGIFVSAVFVVIVIFFLKLISYDQLFQGLLDSPVNASKINPYKTGQAEDFNLWYFLIGVVGVFYNKLSWQGTQGYNSSARTAHEAKMGQVLSNWRGIPQLLFMLIIPVFAYVVMHHPDFSVQASSVQSVLNGIDSKAVQSQMRVPVVMSTFLPPGLLGAFAAVMLAAFISTHDTYLHSWGSIFIQDVLLPLRKEKPLSPEQHIRILRLSIIGVAVFIFFFSLLFKQTQYINMFWAVTAALFVGGSGAVIIGGLYWKHGTTAGAWAAMATGAIISVVGIFLNQVYEDFPVNGQWFWLLSMIGASLAYVLFSLFGKRKIFNLDKLLHRGKYAIEGEHEYKTEAPLKGWRVLGIGKEFSKADKFIYLITYIWILGWVVVFIVGTFYYFTVGINDAGWMRFWFVYIMINLAASIGVTIWFAVGGAVDIRKMFRHLKTQKRDDLDNGMVRAEE